MSPENFIIGLLGAILFFALFLFFGLIRTKRKYEKGKGLLQNPGPAKILKIIFLGFVATGIITAIIGFIIFLFSR